MIVSKFSLLVNYQKQSVSTCRAQIVFERNRSKISVDDIAWLLSKFRDPHSELSRITDRGAQEHIFDVWRQHNDGFFPNYTSFLVSHIMDFIKYHPFYLSNYLTSSVNHISQNFGSHHQAGSVLIDSHISSNKPNIRKLVFQFPIFLIGESFDW